MRTLAEEESGRDRARSAYLTSQVTINSPDNEWTAVTHIAYEVVADHIAGRGLVARAVEFVRLASGEMVILEARGQSSVTGHGRQGISPDRISFLRSLSACTGYPVLFVFVEGYQSYEYAWLHDLRDGRAVAPDRFGFRVKDMTVVRDEPFALPTSVTYVDHDQATLLDT